MALDKEIIFGLSIIEMLFMGINIYMWEVYILIKQKHPYFCMGMKSHIYLFKLSKMIREKDANLKIFHQGESRNTLKRKLSVSCLPIRNPMREEGSGMAHLWTAWLVP